MYIGNVVEFLKEIDITLWQIDLSRKMFDLSRLLKLINRLISKIEKWKYQLVFVFRHMVITELNIYSDPVFAGQSLSSWISYFIRNVVQIFINPLNLAQISNRQTREDYLENFRWQVYQRLLRCIDIIEYNICTNLRHVWHLNGLAE